MRGILCTVFLVCTAVTLAAEQQVATKAATADVQQIRFHEYTEVLTRRDLATLDKIWAEGYTFLAMR